MSYTVAKFVDDIVADPLALGVAPGQTYDISGGAVNTFIVRLTNTTAAPSEDTDSDHAIRFPIKVRLVDMWIRKINAAVSSSTEKVTVYKSDTKGATAPSSPTEIGSLEYDGTKAGRNIADTEVYHGGCGTAALKIADAATATVDADHRVLARFASAAGTSQAELYLVFQKC